MFGFWKIISGSLSVYNMKRLLCTHKSIYIRDGPRVNRESRHSKIVDAFRKLFHHFFTYILCSWFCPNEPIKKLLDHGFTKSFLQNSQTDVKKTQWLCLEHHRECFQCFSHIYSKRSQTVLKLTSQRFLYMLFHLR